MKKISMVPELINYEEIRFFDANTNVPVSICQRSEYKFNPGSFCFPFLIIDNFSKDRYQQVDIRKIDLQTLERLGYRIVAIRCTSRTRNYPRQQRAYLLESSVESIPNSIIQSTIPKEHSIELDVINSRVRLKGWNVYPFNRGESSTPWREVTKKN